MNREELLEKYQEDEDRIFAASIIDKIKIAKTRNQIVVTDFLDMYKKKVATDVLNYSKEKNYIFYTKYEEMDKPILLIFPQKYEDIIRENKFDYSTIIQVIRVELPNELKGRYSHKDYLSGIMKMGIKREKVGDIIMFDDGADILVKADISEYIYQNIKLLTRFSKAKFKIVNLEDVRKPNITKKEIRITVQTPRIDSIVSELINCSRNEATDLIREKRVFVNYECTYRNSKNVEIGDVVVIRGKGKFKIIASQGETKKGKIALCVEHYI